MIIAPGCRLGTLPVNQIAEKRKPFFSFLCTMQNRKIWFGGTTATAPTREETAQQQMLKGVMPGDKLDTAHAPGDKLDTSHALGDKLDTSETTVDKPDPNMLLWTIWLYAVGTARQLAVCCLMRMNEQSRPHLEVTAIGIDEGIVGVNVWMQARLDCQLVHLASPLQLLVIDAHHDQR